MDIFEHARNHHRRAVRLVGQLQSARSGAQCDAAFAALQSELRAHERVEAELLYPALREAGGMQAEVGGLLSEHTRIKALSARAGAARPHSEQWRQAVDALASSLGRHVHDEESEVFPRARETVDGSLLDALAEAADGDGSLAAGNGSAPAASGAAAAAEQRIVEWTDEWRDRAQRQLKSALREQGRAAAGHGHDLAGALREVGEKLRSRGDGDLSRYLVDAADGLDRWTGRLEQGDVQQVLDALRSAASRHPGLAFGGAVGAGFLIARFLSGAGAAGEPAAADEHEAISWVQSVERVDPGP